MRALLDTHTFLWWITDSSELSMRVRDIITDSQNQILFSAASAWEIAIKAQRGRLQLPSPPAQFIAEQLHRNQFVSLPIQMSHALQVYDLPEHHRDPFDRLLVAQCQLEQIPLISGNPALTNYDLEILW